MIVFGLYEPICVSFQRCHDASRRAADEGRCVYHFIVDCNFNLICSNAGYDLQFGTNVLGKELLNIMISDLLSF
jgi:hypothetical protein